MKQPVSNIVLPLSKLVLSDYLRVNYAPYLKIKMTSASSLRRKRIVNYIEEEGDPSLISCDYCFKYSLSCIVISSTKSLKYALYALKGIKCVNVSWDSLNKTRSSTKVKINDNLEQMEKA
jgi:hypothetical protein